MKIEKLEIKGFGKLNNLALHFSKGLNVIYGKNETGKTSIQWFIKGMLFGLKGGKASKDGVPPPIKRFKPWNANDFTGYMEYKLDNGELYRIGRNFANNSTRIFDSIFNDITSTFDISKEKGVAFSEKQLGLNEPCFDRTVFVRQMEAVIDDDGSKELLNRLVNVSQTGFEDVSFKKAQEALKEALKNYVGTDKTTTRPLDKIVNRMEELKAARINIVKKRETMFLVEEELNKALASKNTLENRRNIMTRLNEYVCLKINIRSIDKLIRDTGNILENINKDEEELQTTLNKMTDFIKVREEFEKFASYDNEDIDKLERDYQKLLVLKEENDKLRLELYRKKENLGKLENQKEAVKIFNNLEDDIESSIRKIVNDLEYLKKEQVKTSIESMNENILSVEKKEKLFRLGVILTAIATIMGIVIVFIRPSIGIPVSFAAAAFTLALYILENSESRKLSDLKSEKQLLTINLNALGEEINSKEKAIRDVYSTVGVDNFEDFLIKKLEYKNKIQQRAELIKDISRIDNVIEHNNERAAELKKIISDKLIEVDIKLGDALEINEKGIREFKYGVRRYKGNEPSIVYTEQRIEDLSKGLRNYLKNASVISRMECNNKVDLQGCIESLETEQTALNERLGSLRVDISELINKEEFLKSYFTNLNEEYIDNNVDEISSILDNENNKLSEELGNILVDIKEYETELKHQPGDEEQIHQIDEEMASLSQRKNQLEDTNISLKTALDVLSEASQELQRDFVPALNNKMSGIINKISAGRYSDLRADDKLALKVISPETGDVVNAVVLSGGTIDQMYLALRIAMAEILTAGKEALPLVMDEVFSQYDDERTKETFSLLKEIITDKQIIFFTCKSREVEIAQEVFGTELNVINL